MALRQELAVALGRAEEAEPDGANARAINADLEARIVLQALQIAVLRREHLCNKHHLRELKIIHPATVIYSACV